MKQLRILLLVLLACLLPLRGVAAAAMLCPGGETMDMAGAATTPDSASMHAMHAMHAGETMAHADAALDGGADDDPCAGEHQGTCHSCASSCCLTPLAFTPATLVQPRLRNLTCFPAPLAPALAFQSGGQDRPPRTT